MREVIIVGAGWAGQTIASAIQQYANAHYRVLGLINDDPTKRGQISIPESNLRLPVLGASNDLVRLVKENGALEIFVAVTHNLSSALFQALLECKGQGVQITVMPVLFEQLTGQVPIEHLGDNWNVALPLDSAEAGGLYPIAKRFFDITGALIGLTLFAILFPLIALAIRLDSPGSLFYTHARVGKGSKVSNLIKLRTMIQDAEPGGHTVRAQAGDARITRVGRLLRKARLEDEGVGRMPFPREVLQIHVDSVGVNCITQFGFA